MIHEDKRDLDRLLTEKEDAMPSALLTAEEVQAVATVGPQLFKFEEKMKGSSSHSALRYSPRFELPGPMDNYFDLEGEDLSPPKRKTTEKDLMRDS